MRMWLARTSLSAFFVLCLTGAAFLLSGCSASFSSSAPITSRGAVIGGSVHGGNQPVVGSNIYLYAAGTGGYGTAARSMLTGPGFVTTDNTGTFSITGDYTCQPGDQVYLLALGGNPGLAAGTNNAALSLMAALGACSQLTSSTFININEVTTVVAAYALSGFMGSATQLSSSGTPLALTGVANAFKSAANLANFTTGTAYATTPAGNGVIPQAEINTLADILTVCVNSDGTGTSCSSLFAAATPSGGATPTDVVQAALNIAHNPGLNVAALFAQAPGIADFQPTLSVAPHDWSLSVSYTGGGLGEIEPYVSTYGIAIDGGGDIWVANLDSITQLDTTGAPISPSTGYLTGLDASGLKFTGGIALDSAGNAWVGVANSTVNSSKVVKFGSGGTILSPAGGYGGGGLASIGAGGMAFDTLGNLWIADANDGSAVVKLSPTGSALSPAGGYSAGAAYGYSVAISADTSGNLWVGGYQFANNGNVLTSTQCGSGESTTMAIDHLGNLWSPTGASSVVKCDAAGVLLSPTDGYEDNVEGTEGVAIDGDNRSWVFGTSGQVGVLSPAGVVLSPSGGYQNEMSTSGANYFAIDGSGNIWVASDGDNVLEFVGLASPVITPLATAVSTNQLGVRP
jgi:hypothetical protein